VFEHQNSSIFEGKKIKSNLKCKVGQAKKGIQDFFTLSMMSLLFDTKKEKKCFNKRIICAYKSRGCFGAGLSFVCS